MSIIRIFFNPLNGQDRKDYPVEPGTRIIDFLQEHYPIGFDGCVRVFVGRDEIALDDLDILIGEEEQITILVMPTGGIEWATIGAYLLQAAIAVAIGYTINLLFPPKTPGSFKQEAESPTYSINATRNQARLGDVIPSHYGTVTWSPDFASAPYQFFYEYSNDQFVDELLCLGFGSYNIEEIYIGDVPVTSLEAGSVQWWKFEPWQHMNRMGVITDYIYGRIKNTEMPWPFREDVFTSPAVEQLEFSRDRQDSQTNVGFSGVARAAGYDPIAQQQVPGRISELPVTLDIRGGDTIVISGTANNNGEHKIAYVALDPTNPALMSIYEAPDTPVPFLDEDPVSGSYNLNPTETVNGKQVYKPIYGPFRAQPAGREVTVIECDILFPQGLYRIDGTSGNIRPIDEGAAEGPVELEFTYQAIDPDTGAAIGAPIVQQKVISGKQRNPKRVTHSSETIPQAAYEVSVQLISGVSDDSRRHELCQWVGLKGILAMNGQVPAYLNTTLLAVRMKATSGLGGAARARIRVKANRYLGDDAEGNPVKSSNPIRVIKDIWKSTEYGMARPLDELDLATLNAYQTEWDALPGAPSFNGSFDQRSTGFDAMQQVASMCAGRIIQNGGLTTLVVDKQQPVRTAVFTAANIVRDSLSIQYNFDTTNDYDSIQIEYRDAETFQPKFVIHPPDGVMPDTYQLFGCTSDEYALQYAKYLRAVKRLRRKEITFSTELDGLIPQFGDRIAVSAPMAPEWGVSGMIVDTIDAFTLRVDHNLTWAAPPDTNQMILRTVDGSPTDAYTVTRGASDDIVVFTDDLTGIVFDAENQDPTSYVFGTQQNFVRDFILSKSEPEGDTTVKVQGQTYTAAIYTDGPPHLRSV